METDEQLRARIRYVAGDLRDLMASGEKLDEVAWRYNLKRRKLDREATQPIRRDEYKLDDRTWKAQP